MRLMALLAALWCARAGATPTYRFYQGVRPLGMGGAGVASVNDETALLINPAALAKLRDHYVTLIDPELEANAGLVGLSGGNVLQMQNPQSAMNQLKKHQGQFFHERAQVFPSLVTESFGLGVIAKEQLDAQYTSSTSALFNYRQDAAGVMGFGLPVFGGIVKFGATARLIDRREVAQDDLNPTTATLSLSALAHEGVGLGADFGLSLSAPVDYLPTFTVVARDLGGTSYTLAKGVQAPTDQRPSMTPATLDAAFAIYPILNRDWRATWTIEYDNIGQNSSDPLSHVHFGTEFNLADSVFVRAGLNQRYWTAGLELAYIITQIQFATYGEEIGTAAKPREDRRYVAKFAIRY